MAIPFGLPKVAVPAVPSANGRISPDPANVVTNQLVGAALPLPEPLAELLAEPLAELLAEPLPELLPLVLVLPESPPPPPPPQAARRAAASSARAVPMKWRRFKPMGSVGWAVVPGCPRPSVWPRVESGLALVLPWAMLWPMFGGRWFFIKPLCGAWGKCALQGSSAAELAWVLLYELYGNTL